MEEVVEEVVNYNLGWISIIPLAIIFIVSIITKRTLFAMFCGVISASFMAAATAGGGFLAGVSGVFPEFIGHLYSVMGGEGWQWITIVVALIGILIEMLEKSGSAYGLGKLIESKAKTEKGVLLGSFFLGLVVFVDDYLSNLTVGATMKRLSDKHKVPRSQLAFIALTMAGPVSLLIPISSWAVTYAGVMEEQGIGGANPMLSFISSIPLIFYAWVILVILLLQILGVIPKLGMIKKNYKKAAETGDVFPDGTSAPEISETMREAEAKAAKSKAEPFSFLIPIVVTILVTAFTGFDIISGTCAGIAVGGIYYIITKKLSLFGFLDACVNGILRMGFVYILFILAYSFNELNALLGMPDFIIGSVTPLMQGSLLPFITFIICAIYAFFTGACWDLTFIIAPIVVPLAMAIGVNPTLALCAVFSGALYGNVLCPYGDGVILTSQATDLKPMDVMYAISPYMLIGGGVSAVLYLIFGFIMG
ncbi:MAG: hypothetical protein LBM77_06950 [Spirochaetaceae bacterium]|jgi:Na+/H+ antiporter NhaC|nr:hypothetical protein [Spirochaetaceae bacterium]